MSRRGDAVHIRVDAVDAAQVGHGHALIRRRHLLVEHLPGVGDEALDGGAGLLLAGATGLLHAAGDHRRCVAVASCDVPSLQRRKMVKESSAAPAEDRHAGRLPLLRRGTHGAAGTAPWR